MAAQPVTEMPKNSLKRGIKETSVFYGRVCASYNMWGFLIHFFFSIVVVIKANIIYIYSFSFNPQ